MNASELKLRKELPTRLRSLGLDESWLQREIARDSSLLGLGELELIKREKIQASGGRVDFIMADADGETRYEIEIMLGSVDESHIIRTIEYWDIERQRYPTLEHRAVIVAEEITARFFNVIRLLNRAVPVIAIQMSAFRFGDEIVLHFTRVLDTYEFSAEPDEGEAAEQVDLAYWQKKANPQSLAVVEEIKNLVGSSSGEPRITYNKGHIALGTRNGYNFCWFHPRRSNCHMDIKVGAEKRPEILKQLEDASIDAANHRSHAITLHMDTKGIQANRDLMASVLRVAEQFSHR